MNVYRFDELGWNSFERLVQALLRSALGIGVEAWGGTSDHGIDAIFEGVLEFPAKGKFSKGNFIFQVKFVENANAKGAKNQPPVLTAVKDEMSSLEKRKVLYDVWHSPEHYTFITNAPLSAALRAKIKATVLNALPETQVHVWGNKDVTDILDQYPKLRQAYPQLLGLMDLEELIKKAVTGDILERSRSVLERAKEYSKIFVPTKAYYNSWDVLGKHHFCVIDGPPEVGKTAIAWMIGLSMVVDHGWEALICNKPDDVLRAFSKDTPQIFIADDAFGRTEYDVSRGREWEKDLGNIHWKLDSRHWLILTSRIHILNLALRSLDFADSTQEFPRPLEVTVDASKLSLAEKIQILYRHAKAARLDDKAKKIVKYYSPSLVKNPSFTPERIRRFVLEVLPSLVVTDAADNIESLQLSNLVSDSIRNPTERMRKSFEALPPSHKWLLVSMVDTNYHGSTKQVHRRYEQLCPVEDQAAFNEIKYDLLEGFIREEGTGGLDGVEGTMLDWIHPSCRDLLIDEMAASPHLRHHYLRHMSIEGLTVSLGTAGGFLGNRFMPLLTSQEDWIILNERASKLATELPKWDVGRLLDVVTSIAERIRDTDVRGKLINVLHQVCVKVSERWNAEQKVLNSAELGRFCKASEMLDCLLPMPNLDETWKDIVDKFEDLVSEDVPLFDDGSDDPLEEAFAMIDVISENEPRLLRKVGFPAKFEVHLGKIYRMAKDELSSFVIGDTNAKKSEAERLGKIADMLAIVADYWPNISEDGNLVYKELKAKSAGYMDEYESSEEGQLEMYADWHEDQNYEMSKDAKYEEESEIRTVFSDI